MNKKGIIIALVLCVVFVAAACSVNANNQQNNDNSVEMINAEGEIMMSKEISEKQSDKLLSSKEYLPIGTVVTVGGENKKLMIVGLLQIKAENNQIYDYSAVLYPEGFIGPSETYLFNKDQISRIHYLGYVSKEQKEANKRVEELAAEANNNK